MDKGTLLDHAAGSGEERLTLARILDKLEQCRSRNIPTCTDFLTPQEQQKARQVLRAAGISDDQWMAFGGYEGAQRQVLLFLPDWLAAEDAAQQIPLRYLRAAYRSEYGVTHRDLLGSLLGLGIVREKVGDLLVAPERCDLVVLESVADFVIQNWVSAGRARVTVSVLVPEELEVPPLRRETVRDTVQSLRLDAVASTGFRMARGKAAALIESGRVQVNYLECVKPDHLLQEGDLVSARGLGKFQLTQVSGVTKKGRTGILLERYL